MTQQTAKNIVSIEAYRKLLDFILKKIQSDTFFSPDTIIALSTGGFPVAAAIAKRLENKESQCCWSPGL